MKYKKHGEQCLIFIVIMIMLWCSYVTFTEPLTGVNVKKNEGSWQISSFDSRNAAFQFDLRIGDVIKEVNGINPNEYAFIRKWKALDQADTFVISRDGIDIRLVREQSSPLGSYELLSLSVAVSCLLIAGLLYRKLSSSKSAMYLSLVLLNIGTIFVSLGASTRGDALGKFWISCLMIALPIILLQFLLVFLKEKGNIHIAFKFFKYLYGFVGFIGLVSLSYFIPAEFVYGIYQKVLLTTLVFFVLGLAVNFSLLVVIYVRHRKQKTYVSTIIKSIWVALFISFSPIISLSFIPQLLHGTPYVDSLITGWFTLFLPLTFAYLITSKRLYDIDVIMRRILFTAVISIIPSAMFMGIIYLLLPHDSSVERLIMVFILFVVILTFVLYSLEYFTTKLEPIMFPRKHQLQSALGKISKSLGSITSFRELKEIILVDLVNTLQVFGSAIAFKYKDSIEVFGQGHIDTLEVEQIIELGDLDHQEYTCFEINRQEEYTSYLVMTQKKTMTHLGTEEREWLSLIITYLAVSLENVHLIRKLTTKLQQLAAHIPNEQVASDFIWFRKLMFELQEKERVRIATELHDTTMQDLFFLKERLHSLLERYMFNSQDQAQMINIVEYIDVINSNLRQSCFELHPYLLKEVGLVQTIEKLVDFEMAVCSFDLKFEALHTYFIEQWDMDRKQHVFRMIQELINNAKKHSQASLVHITLDSIHHTIYLHYEDDGLGFDPNNLSAREIGSSGIGMEQMKARILSLNGQFELITSKGSGMKFAVTIPMREGRIA